MTPIDFPAANKTLGAPAGSEENVAPLRIYNYNNQCISCWQLSEEELAEVVRTRCVYVNVLAGETQPPVYVATSLVKIVF